MVSVVIMKVPKYALGIDVSSKTFTVTLSEKPGIGLYPAKDYDNIMDGFDTLTHDLKAYNIKRNDVIICMESTGVYGEHICHYLYNQGYNISVEQALKVLEEHDLYATDRKLYTSDLLKLYKAELSDTEISKETNMTVAGVGSCKQNLRKLLGDIENKSIYAKIRTDKIMFKKREHDRKVKGRRINERQGMDRLNGQLYISSKKQQNVCTRSV